MFPDTKECVSKEMGNTITTLDRRVINNILKNGNPKWPYYPLNDYQSKDLFLLRRKQLGSESFKVCEKVYECPVTHMKRIGYYNGEVVAFRFEKSHRPFIFFQHRNENFKAVWKSVRASYKDRKAEGGIPLKIVFYKGVGGESDFYWVSSIAIVTSGTGGVGE